MLSALKALAPFWQKRAPTSNEPPALPEEDLWALGWLTPARFAPVAREVAVRDILDPLATIGITISPEGRAALLAL